MSNKYFICIISCIILTKHSHGTPNKVKQLSLELIFGDREYLITVTEVVLVHLVRVDVPVFVESDWSSR